MPNSSKSVPANPPSAQSLPERVEQILDRIEQSCLNAGRAATDVKLVAASKNMPDDLVWQAAEHGIRCLGENRPEALAARLANPLLQSLPLEWHLIGPLQSRKVKRLSSNVKMIQSVDRLKTAELLSQLGIGLKRRIPILLQVNPALEESKNGISPNDVEAMAIALSELAGVEIQGLMAMTPWGLSEKDLRRHFRKTRETLENMRVRQSHISWRHLSMGMSQDFEIAIEEGATIVRVGTAIFGPRPIL